MVPCVCYGFVALTVFGCWLLFVWGGLVVACFATFDSVVACG